MMNWFRDLSKELRVWLGVGIGVAIATIVTITAATILRERDREAERIMSKERTERAIAVLLDSVRMEIRPLKADTDTLKLMFRNFVWIIAITGVIYV